MVVKLKIKSLNHPALNLIVQEHGLELKPLMENVPSAELYFKLENPSLKARAELQTCEDVEYVNDDHGGHVPL